VAKNAIKVLTLRGEDIRLAWHETKQLFVKLATKCQEGTQQRLEDSNVTTCFVALNSSSLKPLKMIKRKFSLTKEAWIVG